MSVGFPEFLPAVSKMLAVLVMSHHNTNTGYSLAEIFSQPSQNFNMI